MTTADCNNGNGSDGNVGGAGTDGGGGAIILTY